MTSRLKIWLAVMTMSLFAIALLWIVAVLSFAYLTPIIGGGTYVVIIAACAILSWGIGTVANWLVKGLTPKNDLQR